MTYTSNYLYRISLIWVFFFIWKNGYTQRSVEISQLVEQNVKKIFSAKLSDKASVFASYEFTTETKKILSNGKQLNLSFDYSKKQFKTLNRVDAITSFDTFLEKNNFKKIYQNENLSVVTYIRDKISVEPDYLELYLPVDKKHLIEIVISYQYDSEVKPITRPPIEPQFESMLDTISFDCEDKAMMPNVFANLSKSYFLYIGDNKEQVGVSHVKIPKNDHNHEWKKVGPNHSCRKDDPSKCEAYYRYLVPIIYEEMYIVTDTINIKDFVISSFESKNLIRKGEYSPTAVLCIENQSPEIIQALQQRLISLNYYSGEISDELTVETFNALIQFQKDYHLPLGLLDYQTLSYLF